MVVVRVEKMLLWKPKILITGWQFVHELNYVKAMINDWECKYVGSYTCIHLGVVYLLLVVSKGFPFMEVKHMSYKVCDLLFAASVLASVASYL